MLIRARRDKKGSKKLSSSLHSVRWALLLTGLSCISYFAFTLVDEYVYQAYQNWAFDQQIGGRAAVTFWDYLREDTVVGAVFTRPELQSAERTVPLAKALSFERPVAGTVLGRVSVPRLGLSAMVREESDAKTLSNAVGHVSATQLAGQPGNFAVAAHRDTLFRGLKDIQQGDLVEFQTAHVLYRYQVFALRVVNPSEVSVLRPDGGLQAAPRGGPEQMLTMITCYPFSFIGSAPKRYIVQARLLTPAQATAPVRTLTARHSVAAFPRKRHLFTKKNRVVHARTQPPAWGPARVDKPAKRHFWKRLFSWN